ncbi:MAG: cytosolic protein [Acidobacteriia bacterium]|nr:cytosolic protein [Terriglobia bacterium]
MSTQTHSAPTASVSDRAWEAIQGAYDLQVHVAPDVIGRRIDDIDLAKEFLAHGLRGFVLKSHYVQTAERAKVVSKAVPGIAAFGALTLNHAVGGLNPVAVEIAGRSGCKIVWMPTVDAQNETAGLPGGGSKKLPFWAEIQRELAAMGIAPPRMTVLDAAGQISASARTCMELIARHDMILATGHLGRHEIFPLVKAANEMKLKKVVVTHAEFPSQNLSAKEQLELVQMGALIEHCFTTMHTGKAPWETVFESIREVGPARCILSTDLGQTINPPVAEGFGMFAQKLMDAGFSMAEVRQMAVANPAAYVE